MIFGGRGEVMTDPKICTYKATPKGRLFDYSSGGFNAKVHCLGFGPPMVCDLKAYENEVKHLKSHHDARKRLAIKHRRKIIIENINKYKREKAVIALQSRWRGYKVRKVEQHYCDNPNCNTLLDNDYWKAFCCSEWDNTPCKVYCCQDCEESEEEQYCIGKDGNGCDYCSYIYEGWGGDFPIDNWVCDACKEGREEYLRKDIVANKEEYLRILSLYQ